MAVTLKQIKDVMAAPSETDAERDARHEAWRQEQRRQIAADKGKPAHFDEESGDFVFSSGRRIYCHAGIFSVSEDLKTVSYGYDGDVPWPVNRGWISEPDDITELDLTADDMRELADMMIARWHKFRETLA